MANLSLGARLSHESSKGREGFRVRFYDQSGKRRSVWLGALAETEAETWRKHIDQLSECARLGDPPANHTTRWVASLNVVSRMKLERVGLVTSNAASKERTRKLDNAPPDRLGPFLDWFISNRTAKPRTKLKWKHGKESLLAYFKANRKLDTITHADAEGWRTWLAEFGNMREGKERKDKDGKKTKGRTDLADATVRRKTGQARQFFNYAMKAKLVNENPFAELPATVYGNDDRKFEVTRAMAEKMLEHAPGLEWKAIIALARFGGLRAPSEVMELKWEDIDFENRRMCIYAPKTAHHRNKGIRYCPIFPELLPSLEDLRELATHRQAKPTDYIITKPRGSESVLRKPFMAILKRAGIPIYPKLFQNLRASRETELMDEYPIKDVCTWLGNSPKVAMEHYAMARQDSFARAAGLAPEPITENGGPVGGPVDGNSGQLPATPDSDDYRAKAHFDQQKPRVGTLLATAGSSGQNGKDRPGRTRAKPETTNVLQGEPEGLPAVGQLVGQLTALAEIDADPLAFQEGWDAEAELERDSFAIAFEGRSSRTERVLAELRQLPPAEQREFLGQLGAAAAPSDPHEAESAGEPTGTNLSITQIRASFVDNVGLTRSDSYIRAAIVELEPLPGFRQKRYRLADVSNVLSVAPHELRFEKLRLTERRNMSKPETELEAEVLEILRAADLKDKDKQATLLKVLRALLGQ